MNTPDMRIALYMSPWRAIQTPTGVGQHVVRMCDEIARTPGVQASLVAAREDYVQARDYLPESLATADVAYLPNRERLTRLLMLATRLLPVEDYSGEQDWVYCPKEQPVATRCARLAVTVHDVRGLEASIPGLTQRTRRRDQIRWKLLVHKILHRSTLIATVSEFTRRRILELYGARYEHRTVVVGNGVSDAYSASAGETDGSVLERYGLSGRPYLCLVGSLTFRKGGDLILSLAESLRAKRLPHRNAVSASRHSAQLIAKYKSMKSADPDFPVDLPGYVAEEDQAALLRHSVALLFPSRYEGFGIAVLEAMAAGAPVICSRNAALPEVAGDAALYLESESVEEMLEAIRHAEESSNGRAVLIARGRERAKEFTWQACAAKLLSGMRAADTD